MGLLLRRDFWKIPARVRQFQKQQGLPTQRSTLPLVFIRLNHMVGQSEPRLVAGG